MEVFSKRQTNIAKGTAILMVLWHHLFYNSPKYQSQFVSLIKIAGIPLATWISMVLKMTLSIFLILSGYGLSKAYSRKEHKGLKQKASFVFNHLFRLMQEYWFVYILFVPLGFFFGRNPTVVYHNSLRLFLADFFGLSYLYTGGNEFTMNAVWWYMSLIIVYYLLFPLLHSLLKRWPEAVLVCAAVISIFLQQFRYLDRWIFPFVLGIYCSERDLFKKISRAVQGRINRFMSVTVFLLMCSFLRLEIGDAAFFYVYDSIFGIGVILFCFWFLSKIKGVDKVLELFGIYSGMIFMFHPFFYEYYFAKYIYAGKYAPVIFITLAGVCLATAFLLNRLKSLIKSKKVVQ